MLKNQRFSSLFRHYAKHHGLRKDDLAYYFTEELQNEDTPETVFLLVSRAADVVGGAWGGRRICVGTTTLSLSCMLTAAVVCVRLNNEKCDKSVKRFYCIGGSTGICRYFSRQTLGGS